MGEFIKAAETSVAVGKSQADVEKLLRRYGARSYAQAVDYESRTLTVTFEVRGESGDFVKVALPVCWGSITEMLVKAKKRRPTTAERERIAGQAERVAWRHLYLFIDATLAAVTIGVQTIEEAFFAHLYLDTTDGQHGRVIDYVRTLRNVGQGSLPGLKQLLLPRAGAPPEGGEG